MGKDIIDMEFCGEDDCYKVRDVSMPRVQFSFWCPRAGVKTRGGGRRRVRRWLSAALGHGGFQMFSLHQGRSSHASCIVPRLAMELCFEARISAVTSRLLSSLLRSQILNVSADATRGEVRKGYHQMSLAHHPDKVGHKSEDEQEVSHKLFVKIAGAYEILSDETKRRSYDIWVRGGRKRRPTPGLKTSVCPSGGTHTRARPHGAVTGPTQPRGGRRLNHSDCPQGMTTLGICQPTIVTILSGATSRTPQQRSASPVLPLAGFQ